MLLLALSAFAGTAALLHGRDADHATDRRAPADRAASDAPEAGSVVVHNADPGCRRDRPRAAGCSLGLAVDPKRPYQVGNVISTRVWDGDVLQVICREPEGLTIIDELGNPSDVWFRVRVPAAKTQAQGEEPTPHHGSAWLPAVRTLDRPQVPDCGGETTGG